MPDKSFTPIRTCIGCRQRFRQADLVRIRPDSVGRSVYSCRTPECMAAALNAKRLSHGLRRPITVQDVERLREQLGWN
ncbi:MAG: YlxR family protein [Armatimonadetes bacterium]|nr:YlxR family protein [Armatimonadota bacterium]